MTAPSGLTIAALGFTVEVHPVHLARTFRREYGCTPGEYLRRLRIEIEDNGVGISEEKMPHVYVEGIGLSNVRERLRVLYSTDFRLEIESRTGEGTVIRIDIPELVSTMQAVG